MIKDSIRYILEKLNENGHEAYLVGGCVRDMVLGREPKDWDICTSALPEETLKLFELENTVFEKGIQHGTVGVVVDGEVYEITTYRIDKEYLDHRRPSSVEFTRSLEEDLKRRDFTMNAMAYSEHTGIVDMFGGKDDIARRLIRAVGDPVVRFEEDALRILRALRFSRELDFDIEERTLEAMIEKRDLVGKVSSDRIREEFTKMLLSDRPSEGIRLLARVGILKYVVPELERTIGFQQHSPFHAKDVFGHTMDVLDRTRPEIALRLAALLHDIAKPDTFSAGDDGIGHFYGHHSLGADMAEKILRRLKYSRKTIDTVTSLVKYHMAVHDIQQLGSVKKLVRKIGIEECEKLVEIYRADKGSTLDSENCEKGDNFARLLEEIKSTEEPMGPKDLAVNGNDLLEMGMERGRLIGETLEYLLNLVLEDPKLNERHILLKLAEKFAKSR